MVKRVVLCDHCMKEIDWMTTDTEKRITIIRAKSPVIFYDARGAGYYRDLIENAAHFCDYECLSQCFPVKNAARNLSELKEKNPEAKP